MPDPSSTRVGLISDTHGLLRPEAVEALRGSDFIIHAGDIGDPGILEHLKRIAPVTAVRGNNDRGPWATAVPETATLRVHEAVIYVVHDIAALHVDPSSAGIQAVVTGHSHRPRVDMRGGVLYVNPGSAGTLRSLLAVSTAYLLIAGMKVTAPVVKLGV